MATHSLSVTLSKISNLLIQESHLLLGVEPYIQRIEDLLRGKADLLEDELDQTKITRIIVDIEDAINELIIRSNHRQKKYDFIQYFMTFGRLSKALFFVMIVMEVIDYSLLAQKLFRICYEIAHTLTPSPVQHSGSFDFMLCRAACHTIRGTFEERNNGEFGNAIISGAIRRFEALEAERQLSPPFVSAADQLDIVSFDEDVDAIIAKLLVEDTRCITISILGAAGIGKTSLAKLVYINNAIVHHFPLRLWVSGASEVDIMEKILGVRGCLTDDQVIGMVNNVFAGKRFLIVVDDSCARDCWTKMRGLFWNLLNGSRIIFTVCKPKEAPLVSETNFSYKLHLRTHDESWALFMHTLKRNISLQLQKDLKKQILRKSGGLPKAIVNLAGLLSKSEATLEEWSDEEPWPQIQKDINRYLPLHLRRCLFYFGLFPADYKIPARRLINLWVAEGLVCGKADEKCAERVAEQCLEELANYSMVQATERKLNGKIKTCCLPEPLRVHWLAKAGEVNFLHSHSNITSGIQRLADHLNPDDAVYHHIHDNNSTCLYPFYKDSVTFLSFDSREEAGQDVGNFLHRGISNNCFYFLWILDLEAVYRPILPKAVSKLTQLKYLGLRSSYLEKLPMFIHKLLNLQTLDLKRTCINTLPRSIWKMQELKHLFLDESSRTMFVP